MLCDYVRGGRSTRWGGGCDVFEDIGDFVRVVGFWSTGMCALIGLGADEIDDGRVCGDGWG